MKLNIGSGKDYREGWVNIDIDRRYKADMYRDLRRGLPLLDNTVDRVDAIMILEHITNDDDFFFIMQEVHRVLRQGGIFHISVPNFKFEGAFSDPTHHRYFTQHTFNIICGDNDGHAVPDGLDGLTFKINFIEVRALSPSLIGIAEEIVVDLIKQFSS